MKPKVFLFALLITLTVRVAAQDRSAAFALNEKLGRGINMGNMFDAPTETGWGNPYRADYFGRIAELGFQHVRIPIRWDTPERAQRDAPYTIDPAFLARIKMVVDDAHRQGLYAIINMHHHEEIFEDPAQVKPRFLAQWEQIAGYFKEYDEKLLFEVLNEPHGKLTPELWNGYFAEALAVIRKTNPTRAVLLDAPMYGSLAGLAHLKVPDDPNIIVSPHYYLPFRFTHQGAGWVGAKSEDWVGTGWYGLDFERQQIAQDFAPAIRFSKENKAPIHVGEFGAYSKADPESRRRWTAFLARWFEQQGFSWAYWEFSASFGIFDPKTNEYLEPLTNALLHDPMPPKVEVGRRALYQSAFGRSTDGWKIAGPAAWASLRSGGKGLTLETQQRDASGARIRLSKHGIPLEAGKKYLVTMQVSAAQPVTLDVYAAAGSGDPYPVYKGLSLSPKVETYNFVFKMPEVPLQITRLGFETSEENATIVVESLRVEELVGL